jgi:hypothetical protein
MKSLRDVQDGMVIVEVGYEYQIATGYQYDKECVVHHDMHLIKEIGSN